MQGIWVESFVAVRPRHDGHLSERELHYKRPLSITDRLFPNLASCTYPLTHLHSAAALECIRRYILDAHTLQ